VLCCTLLDFALSLLYPVVSCPAVCLCYAVLRCAELRRAVLSCECCAVCLCVPVYRMVPSCCFLWLCRAATALRCLQNKALVQLESTRYDPLRLEMTLIQTPTCDAFTDVSYAYYTSK
jgi:hypothetical protein